MILIAAGSSLPVSGIDSQQIVLSAFFSIGRLVDIYAVSSLYKTPAEPNPADPEFVNAVASVGDGLSPAALLAALHAVEDGFGRKRSARNAPRTLDLDIIAYHNVISDGAPPTPILPHPSLESREFVLAPLAEIAPDWRHPVSGKTAKSLLAAIDPRKAQRIS